MMQPHFNSFIPVVVIDEDDSATDPRTEIVVSLPAIPQKGDTIVLSESTSGQYRSAVVTDVVYCAWESSPTPLRAYVRLFVSYSRTRAQVEAEG